ncbi:MAG: hypothetical protein WAN82_06835 [Candidatus Bathyarchaeia archaeon]
MKVRLEGSLRKAPLKGCLWTGESDGSSEGGQDEAGQQPRLQHQQCTAAKTSDGEPFSKFCFL